MSAGHLYSCQCSSCIQRNIDENESSPYYHEEDRQADLERMHQDLQDAKERERSENNE